MDGICNNLKSKKYSVQKISYAIKEGKKLLEAT